MLPQLHDKFPFYSSLFQNNRRILECFIPIILFHLTNYCCIVLFALFLTLCNQFPVLLLLLFTYKAYLGLPKHILFLIVAYFIHPLLQVSISFFLRSILYDCFQWRHLSEKSSVLFCLKSPYFALILKDKQSSREFADDCFLLPVL